MIELITFGLTFLAVVQYAEISLLGDRVRHLEERETGSRIIPIRFD